LFCRTALNTYLAWTLCCGWSSNTSLCYEQR